MKKQVLIFLAIFLTGMSAMAQVIDVKADAERFDPFWSKCVGAGRAHEGLRAGWLEQLAQVKQHCGFEYVRFHGLFHDDMCIYFPKNDGKVVYNWQYVDELFDRMLDIGVKPFVELGFFPKEIARENSKTQFWWKASISVDPDNFDKWHNLVKAFTEHVVDRYGIEEVLTWYFEVWNEPNLNPGFLDGTKSDYFRLYKGAVLAVKSVNSRLRVGGPSTSNYVADNRYEGEIYDHNKSMFYKDDVINDQTWESPWMREFLEFCEKEGLPVDFVTTHPYPTDYALDPETGRSKGATRYVNSTKDDILWLRDLLAKSKYPNAEIHLTEWSTSPNSRDQMHDHLPPAAYIMKVNLDCVGLTHSLSYWTFTDIFEEKGGGETIFHGGFGMINFQGIVKPSFHAYRMLHQLGDEKLYYSEPVFVSRNSKTGKIVVVAYNYPEEYTQTVPKAGDCGKYMNNVSVKSLDFKLKNLKPGAVFEIEILDYNQGNAILYYGLLGSPHSPNREQTSLLKQQAWDTGKMILNADNSGLLHIDMEIAPWSCLLIREL